MPAWNRQLTPQELREVVAFVGSLRGTNVPGKAPEGNPVP
jgi:cytochrome c oxidase cbb3-type subunit 3